MGNKAENTQIVAISPKILDKYMRVFAAAFCIGRSELKLGAFDPFCK